MHRLTKDFLSSVTQRNQFLEKALKKEMPNLTEQHLHGLENLLSFFQAEGLSMDAIAEAYMNFVEFFMEERKYFYRNGAYRYSSYAEAAPLYQNQKYMESYMVGLSLSIYLLQLQRDNMDFFIEHCRKMPVCKTARLLEVGTGHGAYFVAAMQSTSLGSYCGIDISPTSVAITKKFISYSMPNEDKKYSIEEKDFFDFDNNDKYDVIILGEILEHVEEPLRFLQKAASLSTDTTRIYVSTAINSPYPDHIVLFKTVEEVRALLQQAGLSIVDEIVIPPAGISLEKAINKKYDIVVAFILKKNSVDWKVRCLICS